MATPSLEDAEFLFATCAACHKSVLTHVVDFDDEGNEVRRCVHCDGEVGRDWQSLRADELEEHGYGLIDARGCGNGGGCSSGCGTRQRG
jgi:hypothetical protein